MKKLIIFLAAFMAAMNAFAQTTQTLSFVTKKNVNIRAAPSPQGKVVGKAAQGMVFITESSKNGWTLVKDPLGKSAYVSASMLDRIRPDEMKIYKAADLLISPSEVGGDEQDAHYVDTKSNSDFETTETWAFIGDKSGKSRKVKAVHKGRVVYSTGRIMTYENYYSGELCGWYMLLGKETDPDGKVLDNRETPIVVYPAFSSNRGAFVDGAYFMDITDTDNWD